MAKYTVNCQFFALNLKKFTPAKKNLHEYIRGVRDKYEVCAGTLSRFAAEWAVNECEPLWFIGDPARAGYVWRCTQERTISIHTYKHEWKSKRGQRLIEWCPSNPVCPTFPGAPIFFFWKFPTKFDVFNIFRCRISDCWWYQALPKGALSYMITDTAPHSNGGFDIKEAV